MQTCQKLLNEVIPLYTMKPFYVDITNWLASKYLVAVYCSFDGITI